MSPPEKETGTLVLLTEEWKRALPTRVGRHIKSYPRRVGHLSASCLQVAEREKACGEIWIILLKLGELGAVVQRRIEGFHVDRRGYFVAAERQNCGDTRIGQVRLGAIDERYWN